MKCLYLLFVLIKMKRLAMYSTIHFDLKFALRGAPLDAARKIQEVTPHPFVSLGLFIGL